MPRPLRRLLVASLAALVVAMPSAASAATMPGIDVSHWNGTIAWSDVRTAGIRFAIMKATEGRSYSDPTYAGHVANATANGIVAGAYHFARPDLSAGDAVAEADHYVDTAHLRPGMVVPVLDLEQTGGLSVSDLQDWARRWLARVTVRTGVHPMIYSGGYFWRTAMGDTTWFADHGYPVYWIPHWGVSSPSVPASNWGGEGWTVWQWTDCRKVKGISGCVDGDVLQGTDLRRIQIPKLTVTTTPAGTVIADVGGIDCPSECVGITDPGTVVTLSATPSPGAAFVGWSGACAPAGSSPVCRVTALGAKKAGATFGYPVAVTAQGPGFGTVTSTPAGIDCGTACTTVVPYGSAIELSAAPDAASEFAGWSGDCTGTDATCTLTATAPHAVVADFEDLAPPTATIATPTTLGGPVAVDFSEPVRGIDERTVQLRVGGSGVASDATLTCSVAGTAVDCANHAADRVVLEPRAPLTLGQDYVVLVDAGGVVPIVDRAGNPLATTKAPFRAATSIEQTGPGTSYRWGEIVDARALGGSYLVEHRAGASLSFTFSGDLLTWVTAVGPSMGRAKVMVDGMAVRITDQYAPSFATGVARTFRDLGAGPHVVTVVTLGRADAASAGTRVVVDAFQTRNGTVRSPLVPARWATVQDPRAAGGGFSVTDIREAAASVVFRGTSVSFTTLTGPAMGKAAIYVDGVLAKTVDLSSATPAFGVTRTVGGLEDGVHTVRVLALGMPGRAGTGRAVAIDAWSVS